MLASSVLMPVWQFVDDLAMGARLLVRLPGYLRNPLTLTTSQAILRARLERREADFLDLVRRAVYANRTSPYLSLLKRAGCEYGDLERLVRCDGLESALRRLFDSGVYLTGDELKGRRPVVRGSTVVAVDPFRLRNPLTVTHVWGTTSGSRGAATRVPLSLASVRDRAVNMNLALAARGGASWRNAVWGTPGLVPLLWYSACGVPAARWFSQLNLGTQGVHPRYRRSAWACVWTSRLAGAPLPSCEHVSVVDPLPIADWMRRTLEAGEVPHLWAFPSSAVRLCRAAEEAGVDLAGTRFTITGEPVTDARLAAIRSVHGDAVPDYGSADSGGSIGYGCLSPEVPDEVHLFNDLNVLIQADRPPFPAGALLVSSLLPTTPFIFLNVSVGDLATITERRCGCPMESLGWRTHMHTISSFEKLTAGGTTFADTDVVRVLEEVLPNRFGGGPTDYQLVEQNAEDGLPCLRLRVHPSVGPVDPLAVADAFLEAIGTGSETARAMALQWRQGVLLKVERESPQSMSSGKVLHVVSAAQATTEDSRKLGVPRGGVQ